MIDKISALWARYSTLAIIAIALTLVAGAVAYHVATVRAAREEGALAERAKYNAEVAKAISDATATFLALQSTIGAEAKKALEERERRLIMREQALAFARANLKDRSDALLADDGLADLAGWLRAVNAARAAARPRPD